MKYGFIITSAINTRFGVYKTDDRLQQTLDTIKSIRNRCDNCTITLIEMAGLPLQNEQRDILQSLVNVLIDFTDDETVKQIYKNDNWDIVKNLTEISVFGQTLKMIAGHEAYKGIDRFFKVSGRYLLNNDFKIKDYASAKCKDKIVFAKRRNSQFDPKVTGGVVNQYMSRTWSFPAVEIVNIQKMFTGMQLCMLDILQKGGYIDIEHLLFLYTDPTKVLEVDKMGVQGLLGPNGTLVRD
jgi:hypothetical protein